MQKTVYSSKGFTLAELLIAVSISAILITSLLVFVSSGIHSAFKTDRVLSDRNNNLHFEEELRTILSGVDGANPILYSGASFWTDYKTGYFLKMKSLETPIVFVGLKSFSGKCASYSGITEHGGNYTALVVKKILPEIATPLTVGPFTYTLQPSEHSVMQGSKRIIGTGFRGGNLKSQGFETELNTPAGLAYTGGRLYVSDMWNNRILSYDIASDAIRELLGAHDGLNRPMSLSFSGNRLLIANGGKGEILSLEDSQASGSTLQIEFSVPKDLVINAISFIFSMGPVSSPSSSGSFSFSWITTSSGDLVTTGQLTYRFFSAVQLKAQETYAIAINNISPLPTAIGNYDVEVSLLNESLLHSFRAPYVVRGDNNLETRIGNVLNTLTWGLKLPLVKAGNMEEGVNNWTDLLETSTGEVLISERMSESISLHEIPGKYLTTKLLNYTSFDCLDERHELSETLLKTWLQ